VTTSEIVSEKKEKSLATRIAWLILICATLFICYFSHLGALGFVGPDEPRYAWIAREMAETGDWVTPRLYGKPWFEKPPLYYWGAALSFKVIGVSEAAARLPSALSVLFATLALAWLAWRLYGLETARWLLLLLPTTVGMIGFSHAAATDMPFSGMLTIAMVCAAVVVGIVNGATQEISSKDAAPLPPLRATTWLAPVLFGFFLGLAALAKGPAAIILCGGTIFFWALFTKRWRDTFRLLHPVAITAFCVTALPWYILCARRNPDFLRVFIVEHNFKRYLTPEFQHIQPFWFYLPVILVAILPWTPSLAAALGQIKRDFQTLILRSPAVFLTAWVIFPSVFFSLSQSKLPGYILPAIPPMTLLCSNATSRLVAANSRFARAVLVSTSFVAMIMFAAAIQYSFGLRSTFAVRKLAENAPATFIDLGLACLLALIAALVILWGRFRTGMALTVAALVFFFGSANLTSLDSALSARQLCQTIRKLQRPEDEVFLCSMPRSYTYAFNFYFAKQVREWSEHDPPNGGLLVIGSPACWTELQGTRYHLRADLDFARWPVVQVEPASSGRAAGGQAQ
jgi:4-amino-4-deoxy-L-arabinose transferase-like glycosyltransferase